MRFGEKHTIMVKSLLKPGANTYMKRFLALLLPLFLLCGCGGTQPYSTDFFAMDTFMTVTVQGTANAQTLAVDCERRVNALEKLLSRTREDSELYQLNHAENGQFALGDETADYIKTAQNLSEQTDGAFDPAVAVLTDLWGIGTDNARVPAQSEIDEALTHVGCQNITLDGQKLTLQNGAQLDLGGIAKGIAADECAAILRKENAEGLLQIGGNIYAVGSNSGKPWVVGIADPDNNAAYLATVAVEDQSIVTSGDYERFFEQNGKRYHHIFDPKTGYPADTGLRGVTVIDADSTRADAFTTALFVMGLEKGMAFCTENGVAAVFITADKRVLTTPQVNKVAKFTFDGAEKGYTYAQ